MGDDSSDEDLSPDWIPYSERDDWKDVIPIPQDDGPNPVVMIAYSDNFKNVYDYFRGIMAINEKSERALELTKDAIRLNAANYTVWQYRRDILKALNSDLYNELEYSENVIELHPKNYQVWHHRRVIVELLNDPNFELDLTKRVLKTDGKNYHAWQHRQWVIKAYDLFADELNFVDLLITDDIRNNSAWNQRFFVLKCTGLTPEILQREIFYVLTRIQLAKFNESSWNFLRGLLQEGEQTLDQYPEVVEFCEKLYESGNRSCYLLAFLIDLYQEQCLRDHTDMERVKELSLRIQNLCNLQITEYDVIRHNYWNYVAENFKLELLKHKKQPNVVDDETNAKEQSELL